METTAICTINGATIQVSNDERQLVPIKPICQALGVDYEGQYLKLKEDDFLSSTICLSKIVASDGKERDMVCLPLEFIYGWLFTINPKNVSAEARPAVSKYRVECYHALYEHFSRQSKRIIEENRAEVALLEEIARLGQEQCEIKAQLNTAKKRLETIRAERLNPQPTLF